MAAQIRGATGSSPAYAPTGGLDSLISDTDANLPDTAIFDYSRLISPDQIVARVDTGLNSFQIIDPIYTKGNYLVNLGNLGSATRDLVITPNRDFGLHLGRYQYDAYRLQLDQFKFYELNRPYANFLFSPVNGQDNFIVKAEFSRDFANDINLSVDFQRISQNGFYQNQATESTYFGIGLRNQRAKGQSHIVLIFNANDESQNGGVTTDSLFFDDFFDQRSRIDVNLNGANTRATDLTINYYNDWHISGPALKLVNKLSYNAEQYKFFDILNGTEEIELATPYYSAYTGDEDGIRYFENWLNVSNEAALHLSKKVLSLYAGINLSYNDLDLDGQQDQFLNGHLISKASIHLSPAIVLNGHTKLGLARNSGDYLLRSSANIKLGDKINLNAEIESAANQSAIYERNMYINSLERYNIDQEKILHQKLAGHLHIPGSATSVGLKIWNITNPIFFDENLLPNQDAAAVQLSQISLSQGIKLGRLHAKNEIIWQRKNDADGVYRVPELMAFLDWGIHFRLFKKRLAGKFGIESRYISAYDGPTFDPVQGIFYNGLTAENRRALWLNNPYLTFKIQKFRFLLRLDNIDSLFADLPQYYADLYPIFDFQPRIGFAWLILD